MGYNYSKLKGKIKEVFDTQEIFAAALEVSTTSISKKLNNQVPFTQGEIDKAAEKLGIPSDEISAYFFNKNI